MRYAACARTIEEHGQDNGSFGTDVAGLKAHHRLGKYRVEGKVADGAFARVYRAYDTIEGVNVALKIPHAHLLTRDVLESFRREARLTARLDHPNILHMKNASFIDDLFVIVYPLGEGTLDRRLTRRMSTGVALRYAEQLLDAAAYAHEHRIIHCDIKPDNLILFPNDRLRLTDFGIAKIALKTGTLTAGGTGTLGYVAPEQAHGKPTLRSDVFSIGLVLYRMFAGALPEWPYDWPPPGIERLRRTVPQDFIAFLRRSLAVDERARFADGGQMLAAFRRLRPRVAAFGTRRRRRAARPTAGEWRSVQYREFRRRHGAELETRQVCAKCEGPVSEFMLHCPWCAADRRRHRDASAFPGRCRRCGRGAKRDWRFCAWCYGGQIQEPTARRYTDRRYAARCTACRGDLMPFMRYCPWCRTKVRRAWKIEGSGARCGRCGWGILEDYWRACAWCGARVTRR